MREVLIWSGRKGFDFHAIDDPQTEWVTRYSRIATETLNPWFSIFYNLDQKYRFLFPKRVEIHREKDIMLNMIEEIIVHKRQTFDDQETNIKESERDLLTLMMEAEKSGEGTMTNDELRVSHLLAVGIGCSSNASSISYRTTYVSFSLLVTIPPLMLYPIKHII